LSKSLQALINSLQPHATVETQLASELESIAVSGIKIDSRQVEKGDAFFCIPGEHHQGEEFVKQAIQNGASCIFTEKPSLDAAIPVVKVGDVRSALACAADSFYDHPSSKMRVLGVTGTNGKTTTTHLVRQILLSAGKPTGLIGTLGAHWQAKNGEERSGQSAHTTPQAPEVQSDFAQMLADGITHVTMEVSSHALSLKRVAQCEFASACLTNITQDHLDFHKSMEQYTRAKLMLFEQLAQGKQSNKSAIINLDDPHAQRFMAVLNNSVKTYTYGFHEGADLSVRKAEYDFSGCKLDLATPVGPRHLNLHLNGPFNVYNVMAALLIAFGEGVDMDLAINSLEQFQGVPGRFEIVCTEPLCIVDYAHTPDGLENILKAARTLVPPQGRLLVVFGCGGDRDASKRPQMGEIAERLADTIIVTSDNPRTEAPDKIIADILAGLNRLASAKIEADRAQAIQHAVSLASERDVIVVAGKGHENYQILGDRTIAFDDREKVKEALAQRKLRSGTV
jgi:UDP-N-acetylmuramoyl-L-alanyl-D-glutamate--2,6-diaminopimelate ligase